MKVCASCRTQAHDNVRFCPNCGNQTFFANTVNERDGKSFGFATLGFFFPVVGLILYIAWMDNMPLRAKSVGKGALIGFITGVIMLLLLFVVIPFLATLIVTGSMLEEAGEMIDLTF